MTVAVSNNYQNISFKGFEKPRGERVLYIHHINNSDVSDSFVDEFVKIYSKSGINPRIKRKIEKIQNLAIGFAKDYSEALPDEKNPNTENLVSTAISVNFQKNRKYIIFLENPECQKIKGFKRDIAASYRHEMGHHADYIGLKLIGMNFSETEGFKKAFLREKKSLIPSSRFALTAKYCKKNMFRALDRCKYVIDGIGSADPTGKRETFAEIFAMLNGGSSGESLCKGMDKIFKKAFPETVAHVQKLLYLLGKR